MCAPSEANPVIPRKIRACLRAGDYIIGGHGKFERRKREIFNPRAERFSFFERIIHSTAYIFAAIINKFIRHAYNFAAERIGLDKIRTDGSSILCCRITAVAPGYYRRESRAVGGISRYRAYLVKRRGIGDKPVSGDGAVGRLEAEYPAERRGLSDRAARVRAERERDYPRRDCRRRARRRAAGHARFVNGIEHRAVIRSLARRAHGEFVHVELADYNKPRFFELFYRRRAHGRHIIFEHPRPAGHFDIFYRDVVLYAYRHARERRDIFACIDAFLYLRAFAICALAAERDEAVEFFILLLGFIYGV